MKYITVPGLRNSGPEHWQSHWERQQPEAFMRVEQLNWEAPDKAAWTQQLEASLSTFNKEQLILIGHSIGCATIVHWHHTYGHKIKGALLVAPSDPERADYPSYITGFAPLPLTPLPFPSIVVASDNDHVVSLDRAREFARNWGSQLITLNHAGHIEPNSGFGPWPEGLDILKGLDSL